MNLLFAIGVLILSAQVFAQGGPSPISLEPIKMESIYSWDDRMPGPPPMLLDRRHTVIDFYALSSGCTDENSFTTEIKQMVGTDAQELSIIRVKPDTCKGISSWKKITLSLKDPLAWMVPVTLANPFPASFDIVW